MEFAATVTRKMPDVFATRQLARYQDLVSVRGAENPVVVENRPFRLVDESAGTVKFREGKEVVESDAANRAPGSRKGLDSWGAFGVALQMVLADVLKAKIGWSHWESNPAGSVAVFRYAVPEDLSHYEVRFCCYLDQGGLPGHFYGLPAYHGEIAIDPRTGAVLRLVIKSDFERDTQSPPGYGGPIPVLRSDVLVEYGPIDIAGKKYICPLRTISVMTSWTLGLHGPLTVYTDQINGSRAARQAAERTEHSRVTAINEAVFTNYHVFRSEMRIISDSPQSHK